MCYFRIIRAVHGTELYHQSSQGEIFMDGFFDTLALYGKGVSIAFGGIGMTLGVTAGAYRHRHGHRSDHGAGKHVEA